MENEATGWINDCFPFSRAQSMIIRQLYDVTVDFVSFTLFINEKRIFCRTICLLIVIAVNAALTAQKHNHLHFIDIYVVSDSRSRR